MSLKYPQIAKLTRPRLYDAYPRNRLFQRLDEVVKHQIIWIAAPPGAGKTTLVTSYLEARDLSGIWYQIDDGDTDPAGFFHHLGLAAQQTNPRETKSLPALTPEYFGGLPAYARDFFRNLFARLSPPFTLVFDNYQNLSPDSLVHNLLYEGLTQLPQGGTVFFISHSDPPAAFTRLRANQNLQVIGWEELRLDHEEIRGILQRQHAFSDQAITALHHKTGGWAAGVVLMMQARQGDSQGTVDFDRNSPQTIFDYFAAEIFNKMSAELQDFLCKTSFLPHMTAEMAQGASGEAQSGRILAGLSHQHYFINQRQQPDGIQFQFHGLFREFLIVQARARFTPPQLVQAQHQAAQVLEQSGQIEQAVALYHEAADWQAVVRIILQQAPALIQHGRNQTITRWIGELPRDITDQTPWLLFWLGVSRVHYSATEARASLEHALAKFEEQQDYTGAMLSWSAIADSYSLNVVEMQPLDDWIQWLTDRIEIFANLPADIQARVASSMASALHMRQPQHPEHKAWTERALALTEHHSDLGLRLQARFFSCFYFVFNGNFARLEMVVSDLKRWSALEGVSPAMKLLAQYGELLEHVALNRFDDVVKTVIHMLQLAEESGIHLWDNLIVGVAVHAALQKGDIKVAQEYLAKMERLRDENKPWDLSYYYLLMAWYSLISDQPRQALEHMNKALKLVQDCGTPLIEALHHQGMMHILYMQGNISQAAEHLAKMQHFAGRQNNPNLLFVTCLCTAQLAFADPKPGAPERGYAALHQAFNLAREHGLTRSFALWLWLPMELSKLCVRALDAGIEADTVQRFIRACELSPPKVPLDCENWPWPVRIYTLGRFSMHADNGKPIASAGKAQHKPLELLKALVALHGNDLGASRLAHELWPELDAKAARAALDVNLHRLRKWLGDDQTVTVEAGRIQLNPRHCWVDAWAIEKLFKKIEAIAGAPPSQSQSLLELTEKLFDWYRGDFLSGLQTSWSLPLREHLHSRFVRAVSTVGEHWEHHQDWRRAAEYYQRALEAEPLPEKFYQRLMVCYRQQGLLSEAMTTFERCQRVLLTRLDTQPSAATQAIYQSLRS